MIRFTTINVQIKLNITKDLGFLEKEIVVIWKIVEDHVKMFNWTIQFKVPDRRLRKVRLLSHFPSRAVTLMLYSWPQCMLGIWQLVVVLLHVALWPSGP